MRRFFFVALAFILSSCASLGVPQATPTVAPTRTATPTMARTLQAQLATRTPFPTATDTEAPELTVVSSSTPTLTITPSLTHTATATASATRTATRTQTNAPTATFTHTPTHTPTPTATDTPTQTLTATVTLLPLLRPTDTPSATFTPTPSPSHTATFTHTFTPVPPTAQPSRTPDQTATAQAQATDTAPPTRTLAPTFTALPQPTATRTIAPTIDAPPTFITAEAQTAIPEDIALSLTPIAVDSTASIDAPTSTPSPAPTVANVNPPPTISIADLPRFDPLPQARVFALGSGGQTSAFSLNISNPTLFAQNPADPNTFLATDAVGLLYTVNNGQVSRFTGSPFSGFETSREDNNAVVIDAAWSPNGAYIAFVVDSDRTENDGVWWYQPGANPPLQLLVDCSPEQECLTVQRNDPPYEYETRSIVWSPQNDAVLAQVYMYDYGRYGQTVLPATRDESIRNVRRPVFQYDSGDWSVDGSRIIVSGRTGDGRVILGSINREGGDERVVLDGGASGLWIQDGVQAPSGELLALGRRAGDANGPMQIIDQQGNTLTPPIGGTPVVRAKWNPERTQVYVETQDGRKYVATTSGEIQDLTDFIGGIRAVSWMGGRLPAEGGANNVPPDYVPAGVIEGARFAPGQQLRVESNTGQLNLRAAPQLDGAVVGNALNGEFVAILAGPRLFDGVEWWQVQLAGGQTGWMAGAINNVPVLVP